MSIRQNGESSDDQESGRTQGRVRTREQLLEEKQSLQVNRNIWSSLKYEHNDGLSAWNRIPSELVVESVLCFSEGDVWSSAEAAGAAGAEQMCGGAAGAGGAGGARPESLWSGSAAADGSSAGGHHQLWTPGSDQRVSSRRDRQVRETEHSTCTSIMVKMHGKVWCWKKCKWK